MFQEAPHPELPNGRAGKVPELRPGRLDPPQPIGLDDSPTEPMLMPSLTIDPALLDPAAIPPETRKLNDEIIARLNAEPVGLTIPEIRARRLRARCIPAGAEIAARRDRQQSRGRPASRTAVIAPKSPRGVFFHIHGGGWSIGTNDQFDPVLERFAENAGSPACRSTIGLRRRTPIRPGRTIARRRRYGSFAREQALRHKRASHRRRVRRRASFGRDAAAAARQAQVTPFTAAILNYGCFDMG